MTTVRQIQRLWDAGQYASLLAECSQLRPEGPALRRSELRGPISAAAMGIIRLDELSQPQSPLSIRFLQAILAAQQADGGWGDVMLSALCIRALLCNQGNGVAIECGLAYLAALQRPEGDWPRIAMRRFPGDALATAFILSQLADRPVVSETLRLSDAIQWLELNQSGFDMETTRLWKSVSKRVEPMRLSGRRQLAAAN